jgi:hypothetical protein
VRHDVVGDGGTFTLRVNGRLHHVGIGRTHARTRVLVLAHDLEVRVVDATTGELLRQLVLDPTRDYQPTGAQTPSQDHRMKVQGVSDVSRHHTGGGDGIRTHGLYIANVALYQLSYTPEAAPR